MAETNQEQMENIKVTFVPRECPTCGKVCAIRKLGVWGYYCVECMMWWGTYDPWPMVEGGKAKEAEETGCAAGPSEE